MTTEQNERYLGDGLYARFDKSVNYPTLWLRAPRAGGDHECALEPSVFLSLLRFVQGEKPALLEHALDQLGYVENVRS